jgi:predicted metalloprotease with PDZ domain
VELLPEPARQTRFNVHRSVPGPPVPAAVTDPPPAPPPAAPTGAWLGVDLVERFENQAMVQRVHPGSPAERAGIRSGDVLLSVAGRRVSSRDHLIELIGQMQPGSDVEIEIDRDRRHRLTDAILGRQSDRPESTGQMQSGMAFDVNSQFEQTRTPQTWEVYRIPPREERRGPFRWLFGWR